MNAQLEVTTINHLNATREAAEARLSVSQQQMRERLASLSAARREASADPCDFNKARVQQVMDELTETKTSIASIKQELRLAGRAVREFIYNAKPAINGKGKSIRH